MDLLLASCLSRIFIDVFESFPPSESYTTLWIIELNFVLFSILYVHLLLYWGPSVVFEDYSTLLLFYYILTSYILLWCCYWVFSNCTLFVGTYYNLGILNLYGASLFVSRPCQPIYLVLSSMIACKTFNRSKVLWAIWDRCTTSVCDVYRYGIYIK